jgi:hypothetical protein
VKEKITNIEEVDNGQCIVYFTLKNTFGIFTKKVEMPTHKAITLLWEQKVKEDSENYFSEDDENLLH